MAIVSLLLFLACPAEQLGVELPPRGVSSVSQDDLQRDTRAFDASEGGARRERLHRRMEEMRLRPLFSEGFYREGVGSCGLRAGRGGAPVLVAARDDGATVAGSAAPLAALVSLAKITDQASPQASDWLYCALEEPAIQGFLSERAPGHALIFGPLSGGPLEAREREGGVEAASRDPDLSVLASGLDYRLLKEQVTQLHELTRKKGR